MLEAVNAIGFSPHNLSDLTSNEPLLKRERKCLGQKMRKVDSMGSRGFWSYKLKGDTIPKVFANVDLMVSSTVSSV